MPAFDGSENYDYDSAEKFDFDSYLVEQSEEAKSPSARDLLQSSKFSDVVSLALTDLKVVEKHPFIKVQMNHWVTPMKSSDGGSKCFACLAGSVMINTLKVGMMQRTTPATVFLDGSSTNIRIYENLLSLSDLAFGSVERALARFEVPNLLLDDILTIQSQYVPYEKDARGFKNYLHTTVNLLRQHGQ